MRKLLVVAFCLLTFGTVTMAQTKTGDEVALFQTNCEPQV